MTTIADETVYTTKEIRSLLRMKKEKWPKGFARAFGNAGFFGYNGYYNWVKINQLLPKNDLRFWKLKDFCLTEFDYSQEYFSE